ncbi:MAG: hypothetical protein LC114_13105 [Bryobacterales bacterium]|nr:hypothetical protein [Bryobacterales bacterium]
MPRLEISRNARRLYLDFLRCAGSGIALLCFLLIGPAVVAIGQVSPDDVSPPVEAADPVPTVRPASAVETPSDDAVAPKQAPNARDEEASPAPPRRITRTRPAARKPSSTRKAQPPSTTPEETPEQNPDESVEPPPALSTTPVSELPPPPLILAPPPPPPPEAEPSMERPFKTASEVIRVILGLVALLGLAALGAHPNVRRMERRLRLSGVITAGLPFVIIGYIASLPAVGVLPETVLWVLRPVLVLALGWIGFVVGFRFDAATLGAIRRTVATSAFFVGAITFASILVCCGVLLLAVEPSTETGAFFRDAILIASAGSVIAHRGPHVPVRREGGGPADPIWGIVHLQQLVGIAGLLIVAAYFRPDDAALMWQLPGTAWLFIALGMGTAVGGIVYAAVSSVKPGPEFVVVLLGSVGITAGMAGFLHLSPIVVCFIAGFVLANLPFRTRSLARSILVRLERPIYLVFLLVSGSLLRLGDWQGWAVMLLLVVATIMGRRVSWGVCRRRDAFVPSKEETRRLTLAPLGALSVAVAVNAQLLYYGQAISWMVTGVIGASIITEVLVQFAARGFLGGHSVADAPPAKALEGPVS